MRAFLIGLVAAAGIGVGAPAEASGLGLAGLHYYGYGYGPCRHHRHGHAYYCDNPILAYAYGRPVRLYSRGWRCRTVVTRADGLRVRRCR
jgi:hypothetical protein